MTFNETPAVVTSASVTKVTTRVPSGAASGPISVITPAGKAVSDADFFVPPGSYTGADVAFTGRINIDGSSQIVTIGAANKIGLLLFNGTAGQRITLGMSEATFASSVVSILKPDGTILASKTIDTNGGYLEDNTLPVTGIYTIVVDPDGTNTGSMKLTLLSVVDITGEINIGSTAAVTILVPGQNARLTFSGTAGQRINVQTVGTTIPSQISILDLNGMALTSVSTSANGGPAYSDFVTLPVTGTYTVFLDPIGPAKGTISVMLAEIRGLSGPITINVPATVTTTVPGQSVKLTFNATAGQQLSVALSGSITSGKLNLLRSDGFNQVTPVAIAVDGTAYIARTVIGITGTHTVWVDPASGQVGNVTVTVSEGAIIW